MRKMTGGCQHLVVIGHRHGQNRRTTAFPQCPELLQVGMTNVLRRREYNLVIGKQLRVGRTDAAFFGTGDGVAGYHFRGQVTKHLSYIVDETRLGAADVRQHGVFAKMGPDFRQHCPRCLNRYRQHHKVAAGHSLSNRPGSFINNA